CFSAFGDSSLSPSELGCSLFRLSSLDFVSGLSVFSAAPSTFCASSVGSSAEGFLPAFGLPCCFVPLPVASLPVASTVAGFSCPSPSLVLSLPSPVSCPADASGLPLFCLPPSCFVAGFFPAAEVPSPSPSCSVSS